MNFFLRKSFLILLTSITLCTHTAQIQSIKEVISHMQNKRTLVVFDIDNTLLMPHTDLGSDQWFCYQLQKEMNTGKKTQEAVDTILPLYFHIQHHIDLTTTEPCVHEEVTRLKKQGAYIICLTARSNELAHRTVAQLQKNQLNFCMPEQQEYTGPYLYLDGILFCNNSDKGEVLATFLDTTEYMPEIIVFIDDKEKNLYAIEMMTKKRGIEFVGLRYAGCDERVKLFDKEKTEKELQEFLAIQPL